MVRISESSLHRALDHIVHRGDTDLFPLPFEYSAISHSWDEIRRLLSKADVNQWTPRTLRHCLAPKRALGLRTATQLDPLDMLLFTGTVLEVGQDIEANRLPKEDRIVHSYRFMPGTNGQIFDPAYNYSTFSEASLHLAENANFVLVTDIADFFPRLYTHRLEGALSLSVGEEWAKGLMHLIAGWNQHVSYGIPVGPAVSRLLSEITISDVDEALASEGYAFCRFSDDYRLFVDSQREAREALGFLANTLFINHGLTLQESKTRIYPSSTFRETFSREETDRERDHLREFFAEIFEGGSSLYEPLDIESLEPKEQERISALNLWDMLDEEFRSTESLNFPLIRFLLQRIRQLGLKDDSGVLLSHVERTYPIFPDLMRTLVAQRDLSSGDMQVLGDRILDLLDDAYVGHLEYHREWILYPFGMESEWNHRDRLIQVYGRYRDKFTRRALILAIARSGHVSWIRGRKHDLLDLSPWERRAFLYGASILPADERKHWFRSARPQLDDLDRSVVEYAQRSPIMI